MTAAPQLMFPDASDHFFVFRFGGRDVERPRAQCCGAFFGVPALSGACAAGDHNNIFTHESSALTMRRSLLPGLRSTPGNPVDSAAESRAHAEQKIERWCTKTICLLVFFVEQILNFAQQPQFFYRRHTPRQSVVGSQVEDRITRVDNIAKRRGGSKVIAPAHDIYA